MTSCRGSSHHCFCVTGSCNTKRAVAIAADHQPEAHRMRRRLLEVGALLLVASEAHLGLVGLGQHRITVGVQPVAIGARESAALVCRGVPAGARAVLVAREAEPVALGDREERARLETVDRSLLVAALGGMTRSRAVAGLALQAAGTEWRARVGTVRVLRLRIPGAPTFWKRSALILQPLQKSWNVVLTTTESVSFLRRFFIVRPLVSPRCAGNWACIPRSICSVP